MFTYHVRRPEAIAGAAICMAIAVGLAVEKVMKDGISSYSLLAMALVMPVFAGVLLHETWEMMRRWSLLFVVPAAMAVLVLAVTLPMSIGLSSETKAVAVASATHDDETRSNFRNRAAAERTAAATAQKWLDQGACKANSRGKVLNAEWCQEATDARDRRLASAEKVEAQLAAMMPKAPAAGDADIAWAMGLAGIKVSEKDLGRGLPLLRPVVVELLVGVFLAAGLGRSERKRREFAPIPQAGPKQAPPIELKAEPVRPALAHQQIVDVLRASGGFVPSNDTLATLLGVTKGEASKRAQDAERDGAILRARVGRETQISLPMTH